MRDFDPTIYRKLDPKLPESKCQRVDRGVRIGSNRFNFSLIALQFVTFRVYSDIVKVF